MRSAKRRALEEVAQKSEDGFTARPPIMCENCGEKPATATYRVRDQYEKRLCENCGMTYRSSFGDAVREV